MKYQVGGAVHASTFIGDIEADTPEEALEKAYQKAHVSVCHQCAEYIQDPEPCALWAEDEGGNVTHEPTAETELAELKAAMARIKASGQCGSDIMEPARILAWAKELEGT